MLALALALALALVLARATAVEAPGGGAPDAGTATVRILFQTVPPERAVVLWGRKPIGYIRGLRRSLVVERPRDSGPLDVVIRAEGYLPVHTRAYTFTDSKLYVRLTRVTEKRKLLGFREELPDRGAPDGAAADGPIAAPDAGPQHR
jgi:hypothetical protein